MDMKCHFAPFLVGKSTRITSSLLFSSKSKFEHSSPWPAFSETIHEDSVSKQPEAWGPLKVCCGKCGNGLGHEFFYDGPREGLSRF
uniref:Methionine sulfoxide reductase B1 n=1 Tax=Amphiprion percula TaxID=161767 RepID=A0A3P8SSJ4_AMPPE